MSTYAHAEAYCVMHYRSDDACTSHFIWNSRDGVTPFVVTIDGVEHTHVDWQLDQRRPNLIPGDNDYVFVTAHMGLDEWKDIMRKRVEQAPQYAPPEGPEREAFIEHLAQSQMLDHGEEGTVSMVTGAAYRAMLPPSARLQRSRPAGEFA